jgi:hypothetical protein
VRVAADQYNAIGNVEQEIASSAKFAALHMSHGREQD